jgi:hypothetical protein
MVVARVVVGITRENCFWGVTCNIYKADRSIKYCNIIYKTGL